MKNLRKIKWENIIVIIMIVLNAYALCAHIQLNGFYNELILELIIDTMLVLVIKYVIKDIRVNPSNWLFD